MVADAAAEGLISRSGAKTAEGTEQAELLAEWEPELLAGYGEMSAAIGIGRSTTKASIDDLNFEEDTGTRLGWLRPPQARDAAGVGKSRQDVINDFADPAEWVLACEVLDSDRNHPASLCLVRAANGLGVEVEFSWVGGPPSAAVIEDLAHDLNMVAGHETFTHPLKPVEPEVARGESMGEQTRISWLGPNNICTHGAPRPWKARACRLLRLPVLPH